MNGLPSSAAAPGLRGPARTLAFHSLCPLRHPLPAQSWSAIIVTRKSPPPAPVIFPEAWTPPLCPPLEASLVPLSACPGEVLFSSPPCKSLTTLSPYPHPSSLLCPKPNCLLHTGSPAGRCGFRKTWSHCGLHVTSIAKNVCPGYVSSVGLFSFSSRRLSHSLNCHRPQY